VSRSYTKLFSSITESTVWCEPQATRIAWITMLAMADRQGRVWASVPGLANRARITVEETETALKRFLAPDHYSRTPDHEGRRIEPIDGGWRLLNHAKYRDLRDEEARLEYQREWDRSHRARHPTNPTKSDCNRPQPTQAAPAPAPESTPSPANAGEARGGAARLPDCPHEQIVALYHELLPDCPKVAKLTPARTATMRARWRDESKPYSQHPGYSTLDAGLAFWRLFFGYVAKSPFLTGRTEGRDGKPPFVASLPWLLKSENFLKCVEGKYHEQAAVEPASTACHCGAPAVFKVNGKWRCSDHGVAI
jgi:hypothetical protein